MRPPRDQPSKTLPEVVKRRRALTHVGGEADIVAESDELRNVVARALDVSDEDERVLAHVHGFHSYPARLHAETAKTLIEALSSRGDSVLDPFCGSGTVPVVARELGRRAFGSDLNPLAVELARLKAAGMSESFARALVAASARVVEHARARQEAELGPTHPYGAEDRKEFATHVLLALDGLRDGIDEIEERGVRHALLLVLSACLTKLSEKKADSSSVHQPKRIARSFPFRFFALKTEDLARRALEFTARVPARTPAAELEICDARRLAYLPSKRVKLVVSSPPYPGVYDYFEHHATRLRWLRLDGTRLEQGEIGTRRAARRDAARAAGEWEADFGRCLVELRRVLTQDGLAALMLADSVIGARPYYADEWLPRVAKHERVAIVGRGSQARPHFHAPTARAFQRRPRREHLFILAPR
ncbi:MAG TPA: DNA methyltransferase [Polyangiaceae bacterium]|nr:DNA methyltransferase [Polyangiaceae bacterium]